MQKHHFGFVVVVISPLTYFCLLILILKREENKVHFHYIKLFSLRKLKKSIKTQKCTLYGEGYVKDWTCQKWLAILYARDFLLNNASQSGRPDDTDSNQCKYPTLYNCYMF